MINLSAQLKKLRHRRLVTNFNITWIVSVRAMI